MQREQYIREVKSALPGVKAFHRELWDVIERGFNNRLDALCRIEENHPDLDFTNLVGDYGETALHLAILHDQDECAQALMIHGKSKLIMKHYTAPEYEDTTVLHLAIAKHKPTLINHIMGELADNERYELLDTESKCLYFKDKLHVNGLPLAVALCVGKMAIVDILVEYGAVVDKRDKANGDTALHSLIKFSRYNPQLAFQTYNSLTQKTIFQAWWDKCNGGSPPFPFMEHMLSVRDKSDCTPLNLACRVGASHMVSAILCTDGVYRHFQWNGGASSFYYYDLRHIISSSSHLVNSLSPSVLEYMVYNYNDVKDLEFVSKEPLKTLIKTKWLNYRRLFFLWCLFHFIFMVFLTMVSFYPPYNKVSDIGSAKFSYALDYITLIICVLYVLGELYDIGVFVAATIYQHRTMNIWKAPGYSRLIRALFHSDCFRFVLFGLGICGFLGSRPISGTYGSIWPRDSLNAFALVFGWCFLLFFLRAFETVGIFSVMLQRIIIRDTWRFTVVFSIILTGFATSIRLFYPPDKATPPEISTTPLAFFNLFRYMAGGTEIETAEDSSNPTMVHVMLALFILLANIQLLNMLIAVMADTYQTVTKEKKQLWMLMRTKCMFMLKRRLFGLGGQNTNFVVKPGSNGQKVLYLPVEELTP